MNGPTPNPTPNAQDQNPRQMARTPSTTRRQLASRMLGAAACGLLLQAGQTAARTVSRGVRSVLVGWMGNLYSRYGKLWVRDSYTLTCKGPRDCPENFWGVMSVGW
jgi:hypothetical protein